MNIFINKIVALTDKPILPKGEPLPADYERMDRKELHHRLKFYIAEMLEHNFEKLCNMMYRHDVPELQFNEALDAATLDKQADKLANVVIEREMLKVETRRAYRKTKNSNNSRPIDK